MDELLKRAKRRIAKEDFSKESWKDDIYALSKEIEDVLRENNYEYKDDLTDTLHSTSEKEMEAATEIRHYEEGYGPQKANEIVRNCMDMMRKYLRYYGIGFIKDFSLHGTGVFQIQLFINPNSVYLNYPECKNKRETKRKIVLNSTEILKAEGFMLEEDINGLYIPDTEPNKQVMLKILKPFNSSLTDIRSRNNKLQEVSLSVWPSVFEKIEIPETEIEIDEAEEIENKKEYMSGLICSIKYAVEDISFMTDHNGNQIENSFADLCTVLDIKTELSEKVKNRHKDIKSRPMEDEFSKKETAKYVNLYELKRNMYDYYGLLQETVSEQSGLDLYDLNVREDSYNFILSGECMTPAPSYEDDEDDYDYEERVKRIGRKLGRMYTYIQNKKTKEKFIAMSDENMKKIEGFIKKMKLGNIHEVKLESLDGQLWIKEIVVTGTVLPDIRKGA